MRRTTRAESLDLRTATPEELDAVINDCMMGYTCPRSSLAILGLRSLYRAVRPRSTPVERVEHLRYPPPEIVRRYGRANQPGKSVFYGATEHGTALLEMRPQVGERFVVSQWELSGTKSPEVRELGLLETLARLRPGLAAMLKSMLVPSQAQGLSVDDLDKHQLIRRFLSQQFTREVSPDSEHEYRLSAAIATTLLQGNTDGVVYASIASVQSGVNVALLPASLDRLYRVTACLELEVIERVAEFQYKARVLRRSVRVTDEGDIAWQ